MRGAYDIVVTGEEWRRLLVVQCTLAADNAALEAATSQLGEHMLRAGIPHGMVVTPRIIRIMDETYDDTSGVAVRDFDATGVPELQASSNAAFEFDARVQDWLESLPFEASLQRLDSTLRSAIEEEIVPLIQHGRVSASGPRVVRERRTG